MTVIRPRDRVSAGVTVEALLIWVYRDQKADIVIGRGDGLHDIELAADAGHPRYGSSPDGVAAMLKIGALGCRIAGSAAASCKGDLHPVAELAHETLEDMGIDGHLLRQYAKAGGAPWVTKRRARLVKHPSRPHIRAGRGDVVGCRLKMIGPTPREVELQNEVIRLWIKALKRFERLILEALRKRLGEAAARCIVKTNFTALEKKLLTADSKS